MADNLRNFIVGATVVINAKIGGDTTTISRVYMSKLVLNDLTNVTLPTSHDLTLATGTNTFILNLSTTGYTAGVYKYQIIVQGPAAIVAIAEDYFVVSAPVGP
jgi:hypothetical protein